MIIKFLVFAALAVYGVRSAIDPLYTYRQFQQEFGRIYAGEERQQHQQIFKQNLQKLIDLEKQGSDVKVTNFTDWNKTQLQSFFNYRPSQIDMKLSKRPLRSVQASDIPSSFNWKDKKVVSEVRDQGSCGSCWAFSTTAAYQSLLAIQNRGTKYDLAEQYLVECDHQSTGCNGGHPYQSLLLLNKTGMPLQATYPYKQLDKYYSYQGKQICQQNSTIKLKSKLQIFHYTNLTTAQLQQDLVKYGPMSVGVSGSDFSFYSVGSSGFINSCSLYPSIDHAVLLYGYNTTHWFIKNSWGTSWGNQGFAYILKTRDCGLTKYVDEVQGVAEAGNIVQLTVKMVDNGGDGWNGYAFGFKQGDKIVAQIGKQFKNGYASGPIGVKILDSSMTQIVVTQKGNKSEEIGFEVFLNNKKIFSRLPGQKFVSTSIFHSFCLSSQKCQQQSLYKLTLTDKFGDGWTQTKLMLKQSNGVQIPIESSSSFKMKELNINLPQYQNISLIATKVDQWSSEIGYRLTDVDGVVILSRVSGIAVKTGQVDSFCVNCPDVKSIGNYSQENSITTNSVTLEPQDYNSYKIATYSLAGATGLLLAAVIFTSVKVLKQPNSSAINLADNQMPMIDTHTLPSSNNKLSEDKIQGQTSAPGSSSNPKSNESGSEGGKKQQQSQPKMMSTNTIFLANQQRPDVPYFVQNYASAQQIQSSVPFNHANSNIYPTLSSNLPEQTQAAHVEPNGKQNFTDDMQKNEKKSAVMAAEPSIAMSPVIASNLQRQPVKQSEIVKHKQDPKQIQNKVEDQKKINQTQKQQQPQRQPQQQQPELSLWQKYLNSI